MRKSRIRGVTMATIVASAALFAATPATFADEHEKRSAGETVDDATVNSSVKANLADNDKVHARNINVETNKGRVALIGYVRDEEGHKAAIDTAKSVKGVVEVIDALLIVKEKRSTGTTLDDQTIETKVKFDLAEGGLGEAFDVVLEVRNGEVLMGGFVDSADIKNKAGQVAEKVSGVTKVHNRLAVK
jgi:osmotically-inducible protein OsmY